MRDASTAMILLTSCLLVSSCRSDLPTPRPSGELLPTPALGETGRQDLFGTWQVSAVPDDPGQAELKATASARWTDLRAPFLLPHLAGLARRAAEKVHYAWARRRFLALPETAFRNAVLHLHGVRWGSRIWLNGQEVGGHLGAYGAFEFDVTEAIAWGKNNELLLRLTGWPQVPKSKAEADNHSQRVPLLPHGPALLRWGNRQIGIVGGAWIDYFDYARLERVQVLADLNGRVRVRGLVRNHTRQFGPRHVEATVFRGERPVATGSAEVPRHYTAYSSRTPYEFEVELNVERPALWSPDVPNLYRMQVTVVQAGRVLNRWSESFGFRAFEARPDGFYLNGRRFFLRGICMWGENSSWRADQTTDPRRVRRFLVDLPRGANLNCVRNHTIPLDGVWLDVADRTGFLVLQEFPLTINYIRPVFTEEELAVYRGRILEEFASMLPLYWNHPSVIVWVESNESPTENTPWEHGPLYRLFKGADPTRPVMRSGVESPDIYDTHCYNGFWTGSEGQFAAYAAGMAAAGRATRKPIGNTEYIENFGGGRVTKWMGPRPADLSDKYWERRRRDTHAQFILEQTEALRRLGYDATLPYAWGGGYIRDWHDPSKPAKRMPNYFAVRSGQAPLLASIDLADRHFATGQTLRSNVVLCDDNGSGRAREVQLLLVSGDPGFTWPSRRPGARVGRRRTLKFPAAKVGTYRRSLPAVMPLPAEPGRYFLLAVLRDRPGGPAAVSRRIIDVVPAPSWERLADRRIAVFSAGAKLPADLARLAPKARLIDAGVAGPKGADVLLVGPMVHRRLSDLAALAGPIGEYLRGGGRVVVLEQDRPIPPLGVVVPRVAGHGGASTAFRTGPSDFFGWAGLGSDSRLLRRFNGPIGAVVRLPATAGPGDQTLALAAQRGGGLDWPVVVRRPASKGQLILCQMVLADHLSGQHADPVAQTILLNLLAGQGP